VNLSVRPGSLVFTDAARKMGFVEENNMRPNYWGGTGAFLPLLRLLRGTLALACSPKGRCAGVRAGGRGSHAPPPPFGDRDDAWMLQGVRGLGALCMRAWIASGRADGRWAGAGQGAGQGTGADRRRRVNRTALSVWRDGEGWGTNNNWYSCTADNSRREAEGLVQTDIIQLPPCVQK